MSFRGGGRRFNNRYATHRGGGVSSDRHSQHNPGFQFTNPQNPNSRQSYPQANKTRICFDFQQGSCPNNQCGSLHQYSFKNEIGRLQQIQTNSPVFAASLIQNSQISVALQGRISIFDIKAGNCVAEFQIQGRTKFLQYSEDFGQGFIFFAGDSNGRQLLGAISSAGVNFNFANVHAAGVNCLIIRRGLIFAGGDDGKASVWYFNGQNFEFGTQIDVDQSVKAQILCLELVGNMLFAGLANGFVVAWEYNFETNQCVWKGNLTLKHNGKVSCLSNLADAYLFSGGEDGLVNCWDCNSDYQGGTLLNATKTKPVQITQLLICQGTSGLNLLISTNNGKILWYTLQGSEAKFVQPLNYHRKSITGLLKFEGLEGYSGFISTSIDPIIHVSNWNMAYSSY